MIHIKRIRPGNHSALICQLIYNEDMPQLSTIACAIVLFSMGGFALAADTTVYRSEGPNGTVQFSDTPPAEGTGTEVLRIRAPEAGDPAAAEQQLKAMRYSTDRLAESRRERELEREVARLRAQVEARPPARQSEPETTVHYVPVYVPPVVIPWHPGHRPHPPQRPGLRPPLQQPGIVPGPNSQLMRPIVSGR